MAENRWLGRLTSNGTSVNNTTTAVPFNIPPGSKLTVVADAASRLLGDVPSVSTSVGATLGVPLTAASIFPTSVGRANARNAANAPTALLAFISASGTANLDVWQRDGNE